MEEKIINKMRNIKRELRKLYRKELSVIDFNNESMADSESLKTLQIISKIDEELTDIIYSILDIKNSKN